MKFTRVLQKARGPVELAAARFSMTASGQKQ